MIRKLSLCLVLLLSLLALAACGAGAADCNQEKKSSCSSSHSSCVQTCNPLGGEYEGCVKGCDSDLCDCLDEGGCDCSGT